MTTTLALQLARRPSDPPIAAPAPSQSTTTSTSKSKKARAPKASTSKRKSTKPTVEAIVPPYEQFGTLPANTSYHLARTAHAIRTARNVIVISGAGVSTPAIPDFRSSRGLFKTLADEVERKGMYDAEIGEQSVERSAAPTGQSGMKSGKELFDVKCLTVSPEIGVVYDEAQPVTCSVSGSAATPPCASQSSLPSHAPDTANTVSSLPQDPRLARPPSTLLYAKH